MLHIEASDGDWMKGDIKIEKTWVDAEGDEHHEESTKDVKIPCDFISVPPVNKIIIHVDTKTDRKMKVTLSKVVGVKDHQPVMKSIDSSEGSYAACVAGFVH